MRHWSVANLSTCATFAHIYYGSFLLYSCRGLVRGSLCKSEFPFVLLLVFWCRFSGGFSEDFLALRNFLKKVVEKFGGDLGSAYLCTRFREPTGPEGPTEGLEQ